MKSIKISGVLLYLFGLVLVLLLYFNYVFIPLNDKISELNEIHNEDIMQIQIYKNNMSNIKNLKNNISQKQQKLNNKKDNAEISGNYIAEDIGKIVTSAGISMQSVNVDSEIKTDEETASDKKKLCSASIELNIICSSEQLNNLVDYFENQSNGIYSINNIDFSHQDNKLNANLDMTLYYFSAEDAKK